MMINTKMGKFTTQMQRFTEYEISQGGWLTEDRECHALFYYYVLARKKWEEIIWPIVLEGDPEPQPEFRQLFKTIARLYGADPARMSRYWEEVDAQAVELELPLLPNEERFRFNKPMEIKYNA